MKTFDEYLKEKQINIDINTRIEQLKVERSFDTYLETITTFYEEETDHEMETLAKYLNKKIIEEITKEAHDNLYLKDSKIAKTVNLFS